jgi:hypothetical protein
MWARDHGLDCETIPCGNGEIAELLAENPHLKPTSKFDQLTICGYKVVDMDGNPIYLNEYFA